MESMKHESEKVSARVPWSEDDRKMTAVEVGLPENATWEEIDVLLPSVFNDQERALMAAVEGLPEDATWAQIRAANREAVARQEGRAKSGTAN